MTKKSKIIKRDTLIENKRIFEEDSKIRRRGRPRRLTQAKGWSSYRYAKLRDSLNKEEYAEYLNSPHWRTFKALYKQSSRSPQECIVCGDPNVELHHWTYERLGAEYFSDVVPLCRGHHAMAHKLEKNGVPLSEAHKMLT